MDGPIHHYRARLHWTGNRGSGTSGYAAYARDHEIHIEGKPVLAGSADPGFRGDPARHNPEDLFLSAVAACHMLFYLALCAREGIRVLAYEDHAQGWLETGDAGGRFREIRLQPRVAVAGDADPAHALALHATAHERCFIANSCSAPIRCEPVVSVAAGQPGAAP